MDLKNNRQGFTLLEIIIVIIIVGVLASLALPRFFALIESSRQTEALVNITSIRQALERYYTVQTISGADATKNIFFWGPNDDWSPLGIDNPNLSPNAHFIYLAQSLPGTPVGRYSAFALRNCRDNGQRGTVLGNDSNFIFLTFDSQTNTVNLCGFGYYKGLKMPDADVCHTWFGFIPDGNSVVYNYIRSLWPSCPGEN